MFILIALALALPGVAAAPPVTFRVEPAAPQFALDEQVVLNVSLELDAASPTAVTVSAAWQGNVRVKRVERDGVRIKARKTVLHFEEDPNLLRQEALVTLGPGESAPIPYTVALDGGLGAILKDVKLGKKPREIKAFVYALSGPGTYTIEFRYRYDGPDAGKPNVFHKALKATTTFQLQ